MRSYAVLLVVILAACAQAPASRDSGGAASDSSPQRAAAQPEQAKPADTSAQAPVEQASQTSGVPSGYSVVERNGVTMYCSNKPQLGTRVKSKTTCMTKEQYEASRQDARDKMREKQGQRQSWE